MIKERKKDFRIKVFTHLFRECYNLRKIDGDVFTNCSGWSDPTKFKKYGCEFCGAYVKENWSSGTV